ncbi:hypothetical protein BOX15_Mlig004301g2 [Macrostomum lignano]|uniref:PUM-HD domain-containing protein n=2 Tax=Macrostomum lignano TaxID=282301 RepID=A0A267GK71_9PLAT|nr:hypothetical protein BOX15_Mlig004301g2 [Macrostomum lignano]
MPLGRKPSAFRKTVSDLKSAAGFGGSGANEGAAAAAAVRPGGRKRKLSEPSAATAELQMDNKNSAAVDKKAGGRQMPRMGRSLANLASTIKKRGAVAIAGDRKRKRPRAAASSSGSEDGDDDDAENGDEAAEDDEFENSNLNDSTIFEDLNESDKKKLKKPNKQQQQKQQQEKQPPTKKERRALKKKQKKNADLVSELLTAWEELRIEATPANRVAELCESVLKLGRGKLAELAAAHDTGRVLEAVLKRGSDQQRWLIFEELKDQLVALAKSKYGRFVAQKLLKYGAKEQRAYVFRAIEGRTPELLKHRFASELVETAYNEFANAAQRAAILQEFFGPELALFKSTSIVRLKDALATKRPGLVMQHLQQHLLALTQKDLIRHSLVQHLLLEYLEEAVPAGASGCQGNADASAVASLMENLRENLVPMLHTREGVKVALLVVRHLSHKDLKRALKSMKTFLCTSACNEHGYLFVLSLAERHSLTPEELHKLVLRELFDSLQELIDSQFGRKVLLYLLSPRDSLHFSPQLMSLILPPAAVGAGGKSAVEENSVTTEQLRERLHRALSLCSSRLLSHVSGRMAELCQANGTILFVQDTLRHCPGEKSACYAALADLIRQPFVPCQNPTSQSSGDESDQQQQQQQHIIECSAGHLMLKRLLPSAPDLVRLINDFVTDENIVSWLACNRGCFFLLQLYESCPEDCSLRDRVATLLLGGGGGGFATALQSALKRQYRGAQLLSERIKAKTEPGSSLVGDRSAGDAESQQPVSKKARRLSKKL